MTYALVIDNEIQAVGRLPGSARIVESGRWLCPPGGLAAASVEQQQACGWFAVTDTPPRFDAATEILVRGDVVLVEGSPVRDYTVRSKTVDEIAADADTADRDAKRASVAQAVGWLRTQAETARSTTATTQNAVPVLNGVIDNVGLFYDHFADFLEAHRFDSAGEG